MTRTVLAFVAALAAAPALKYSFEQVVLSDKLAVLKDDANGLYCRLTEAVRVFK